MNKRFDDHCIAMALESEACGLFVDAPMLYTGLGKINAAYRLTQIGRASCRERV